MISCHIQYKVDLSKLDDFEKYAKAWVKLIEKYGGTHCGYFLSDAEANQSLNTKFSFPELGKAAANDIAIALFSFPDVESYENYKKLAAEDEECKEITSFFETSKCFEHYERSFMKSIVGI